MSLFASAFTMQPSVLPNWSDLDLDIVFSRVQQLNNVSWADVDTISVRIQESTVLSFKSLQTLPSAHIAAFVASLIAVGVAGVLIYYAFLHPLAKYPGPFLAKFTDAYAGYHGWRGDIHLDMWKCHEKYGSFVRYGPNKLMVNTATGLKDIYGSTSNVSKSQGYQAMVHRAHNTLTMFDRKEHGRRRRVMSQGFSDAALRTYGEAILAHVHKLCRKIRADDEVESTEEISTPGWTTPKNMAKWCNYLAFDIMADIVFGKQYNLLEDPKFRYVVSAIEDSNIRISVLVQCPSAKLFRLDKWLFPQAIHSRNRFVKFVSRLVFERMKTIGNREKDVFSILTTAKDPQTGSNFRNDEIGAESTTLIVAGSDTSSTTMTGVFFYLSHYPDAYTRVVKEVRDCFSSVDEIRMGPKLNSCTFLRACIDESLRMSPAVGTALFREVLAAGARVDGEFIPRGTDVGVPIYSIQHNAEYYPDPFVYRPERWLVGEGNTTRESVDRALSAFNPFSVGPRSCIGKGLALIELMLTMAVVIYSFDFKVADGPDGKIGEGNPSAKDGRHRVKEFQLRDHVTSAKTGPFVQFCSRGQA